MEITTILKISKLIHSHFIKKIKTIKRNNRRTKDQEADRTDTQTKITILILIKDKNRIRITLQNLTLTQKVRKNILQKNHLIKNKK